MKLTCFTQCSRHSRRANARESIWYINACATILTWITRTPNTSKKKYNYFMLCKRKTLYLIYINSRCSKYNVLTYSVNFKCSILWSKYLILEVVFLFLFSYQRSIFFQKTHQFHTTGPIIHGDKCTWIHLQGLCTCLHFYMGNLHIRWFLRKIIIYIFWKGSHLN